MSGSPGCQRRHVVDGLHEMHLPGIWPIVPSTSACPAWPTSTISRSLRGVAAALGVHLGDQRAGRVDHRQAALARDFLDPLGHAVRAEHGHRARRDFVQLVDEHGAARAQVLDDMAVVDDLVAHIDRRPVFLQRPLDDLDRALDAGAETARLSQNDP